MNNDLFTFKGDLLEECDLPRLETRARKVWDLMADGHWHDLNDIARQTGYPHSSVTACVRAFRYPENGGHTVEIMRKKEGRGTWLYRLVPSTRDDCRGKKAMAEAIRLRKVAKAEEAARRAEAIEANALKIIPIDQELPEIGHHVILFGRAPIIGRRAEYHLGVPVYRCCFDGEIIPWEIKAWAEIVHLNHRVVSNLEEGN